MYWEDRCVLTIVSFCCHERKEADSEGDSFSKKIVFIIVTFGKSALSSLPTFAGFGGRLI